MRVDGCVSRSTSQILVFSIRDVQMRLGISILLGQTKVDDIDLIAPLSNTHEEVVRLDVSVDEVTGVNVFDTGDLR